MGGWVGGCVGEWMGGFPWVLRGVSAGSPWGLRGVSAGSPWGLRVVFEGSPWGLRGSPGGLRGASAETPRGLRASIEFAKTCALQCFAVTPGGLRTGNVGACGAPKADGLPLFKIKKGENGGRLRATPALWHCPTRCHFVELLGPHPPALQVLEFYRGR